MSVRCQKQKKLKVSIVSLMLHNKWLKIQSSIFWDVNQKRKHLNRGNPFRFRLNELRQYGLIK